ncbi:DUF86 domain-containing protein [Paenibacillus cymbidii]|uniref:DUF86 domain-containing protein n=1 Tax=Paenibacillus cymbidii TaxID=1639034 RepID=UPI0010810F7F|nr:HepT-like ribonuclease domain-containing protein [Paenibacillus cymbidii]
MYYLNREQFEERLRFVPVLVAAASELSAANPEPANDCPLPVTFAAERVLHLAIETVTDIGSLLIDAFMMRDASSYDDIVEIIRGEGAIEADTAAILSELVALRRPLVQQYFAYERGAIHPLVRTLPGWLPKFGESVRVFVERELVL